MAKREFSRYTMERKSDWDEKITCYGWKRYGRNSVLAGQEQKCFLDVVDSEDVARREYPGIEWGGYWSDPQPSLSHLDDTEGSW